MCIRDSNPIIETYPGTIGIKSGYTTLARNTFIGAATRGCLLYTSRCV